MSRRAVAVALLVIGLAAAEPATAQPAPELSGSSDWRTVSAGNTFTCAIRTTGRLYCWGSNEHGQAGSNPDTNPPTPTQVTGGGVDWTAVSTGEDHACGIRRPGRLYCWGKDDRGQVGDGAADGGADQVAPVRIGTASDWKAVSAGTNHTCGRRGAGRLWCWGSDEHSQLGNGVTDVDRPAPSAVAGGITDWRSFSAGGAHTCAVRANRRAYCWGLDASGQIGDAGTATNRPTPRLVAGGATNWTSVSLGSSHTCGLQSTGQLYCWGWDQDGQLGNGGGVLDPDRDIPVPVIGGAVWSSFDAGFSNTCARRRTGRLFCWGTGALGQNGNGSGGASSQVYTPMETFGGATDWTMVSMGFTHACARITTSRLYCWGQGYGNFPVDVPA
jgi:alpha-tubulin suppressor-like RCC1 family protein